MNKFEKIYEDNKFLDKIFEMKYGEDKDLFKKNCIEFLVELGEFINETKCFKYWTIKKANKEKMLDEFADCVTMILYFYNNSNLELDEFSNHHNSTDVFEVINYLYLEGTNLINNYTVECVKNLFSNLLYLGDLLELNQDEIVDAISNKQKKIKDRLNSEY